MECDDIFADNEMATYDIRIFKTLEVSEEIGKLTTCLTKKQNEVEISTETTIHTQGVSESTTLRVLRRDLSPLSYQSHVRGTVGEITITGEYQKNKVKAKVVMPDGVKRLTVNFSTKAYDNSAAIYVFRAAVLGFLSLRRFYLMNLNAGQKGLVEIEQTEEEVVKCALGEFTCLGLKVTFCESPRLPYQKFLYKKETPHYLLRSVVGPQVVEISKYGEEDGHGRF